MIGARSWRKGWWLAAALSVGVHGVAGAAFVWQPSLPVPDPAPSQPLHLDVTPLAQSPAPDAPALLSDAATPRMLDAAASLSVPDQVLTPVTPQPDLLLSSALPVASAPQSGGGEEAALPIPQADGPPPDPRIAQMFDRIRNRLTEPCLLALPALLGEDEIQLSIMAASDRQITALMRDLTADFPTTITERSALLDARQCPALTFARRDPGYPLPGLSLQLDAQDIASGGDISGRVAGGAGLYTTLLLIDDNGVVHDMRRFLVGSATQSRFRVPAARTGQARDTVQILLAVATPGRPDAITRHAGKEAEDFFRELAAEVGSQFRVGAASIYLR